MSFRSIQITPTIPGTTGVWTAGDVLFSTTELTNVTNPQEPSVLVGMTVGRFEQGTFAGTLYFFNSAFDVGAPQDEFLLGDTDVHGCIGALRFGSWTQFALPGYADMYQTCMHPVNGSASVPHLTTSMGEVGYDLAHTGITLDTGGTSVWVAGRYISGTVSVDDAFDFTFFVDHKWRRPFNGSLR